MKTTSTYSIQQFDGSKFSPKDDAVCQEKEIALYCNNEFITNLICLDSDIDKLAAGYLIGKNIITLNDHPESITCGHDKIELQIDKTDQPRISEKSDFKPAPHEIIEMMDKFMAKPSAIFDATGGVHAGALMTQTEMLFCTEDISRHNVLDKILGFQFLAGKINSPLFYLTTGRINSEIIKKVSLSDIAAVISRSAVTAQAIEIARQHKIHLFGFARNNRFNAYA
jgi:FdhD protein